jgi:hypothetical protein
MLAQLKRNGWQDYAFARIAYYQFDQSLVGLNIAENRAKARRSGSARAPRDRSLGVHAFRSCEPSRWR